MASVPFGRTGQPLQAQSIFTKPGAAVGSPIQAPRGGGQGDRSFQAGRPGSDAEARAQLAATARPYTTDRYGNITASPGAAVAADGAAGDVISKASAFTSLPTVELAGAGIEVVHELVRRLQHTEAERDTARQDAAHWHEEADHWREQAEKAWELIERLRQMPFAFADEFGREVVQSTGATRSGSATSSLAASRRMSGAYEAVPGRGAGPAASSMAQAMKSGQAGWQRT